jgi:hypothetical protein
MSLSELYKWGSMDKLPRYNYSIVECGIKHHKPNHVFTKTYTYLHIYRHFWKVSWIVKSYGKCGRMVGWIVKWYGKYGRKVSWIVKRFGKYRRILWNYLYSIFSPSYTIQLNFCSVFSKYFHYSTCFSSFLTPSFTQLTQWYSQHN